MGVMYRETVQEHPRLLLFPNFIEICASHSNQPGTGAEKSDDTLFSPQCFP